MLRATIALGDSIGTWHRLGSRWVSGMSWIEPFPSQALETFCVYSREKTLIVVRERLSDQHRSSGCVGAAKFQQICDAQLSWPAEALSIELSQMTVTVTAGTRGSAPVYAVSDHDSLQLSWSLPDFRPKLTPACLDHRELALYLTGQTEYSYRTIWTNALRLTERSQLHFGPDGLSIRLPPPAQHCGPRQLAPDADPIAAYDQILGEELSKRVLPSGTVIELSGGLDSANVAVTAAALLPRPRSYGLAIGGIARAQQISRRSALVRLLGLTDVLVDAMEHVPFEKHSNRRTGGLFDPGAEPYQECLADALRAVEPDAVLTGIGGDELMGLLPAEREQNPPRSRSLAVEAAIYTPVLRDLLMLRPDDMPATVLHEPALDAAAVRAPVFLEHGTWPINPLAAPDLTRFCEWLPVHWRRDRKLHRDRLIRAGLDAQWPYPPLRENFSDVMAAGLAAHGRSLLCELMADSRLADLALIEPRAVQALCDRLPAVELSSAGFYEILNLELALRAM